MLFRAENLDQYYGSAQVLRKVGFEIKPGECLAVLGRNGAGKTTLLKCLMGVLPIARGRVLVDDTDISGWPSHKRSAAGLAYVPQGREIFSELTVAENIALRSFERPPLSLGGWLLSYREIRTRAADAVTHYKVKTPSLDSAMGTLSGGNVQRAVLARELGAGTTRILVAANPCFGLDFAAVDFIHSQIIDARNHGVAVLLICEDIDELLSLSDRVLVMTAGRLVYEAPVSKVSVKELGEKMAGH